MQLNKYNGNRIEKQSNTIHADSVVPTGDIEGLMVYETRNEVPPVIQCSSTGTFCSTLLYNY